MLWERDSRGIVQRRRIFGFCRPRSRSSSIYSRRSRSWSRSSSRSRYSRGSRYCRRKKSGSRSCSTGSSKRSGSRSRGRRRYSYSSSSRSRSSSYGRRSSRSSSSHETYDGGRNRSTKRHRSRSRSSERRNSGALSSHSNHTRPSRNSNGRQGNHNEHKIDEKDSPGGSSFGNSSSKENCLPIALKSSLDEDGFKPRVPLNTTPLNTKDNTNGIRSENRHTISADNKFSSECKPLSKDVQFLLKLKRLRKQKLLEDAIVSNLAVP